MPDPLHAILIGDESLLVQCGQRLLERGHVVAAIATRSRAVRSWADVHDIPAVSDVRDLAARFAPGAVDVVLAIAHLRILPEPVLRLARREAINFHDGPLPEYAGLNTPVWAIINGERTHGITWHRMTSAVDRGDILVQRRFEIDPRETALTLNTKCYEHALLGFETLLEQLERGALEPAPQPRAPDRLYGRTHRPEASGTIDWEQPAERIDALVRALDFGPYANPLTVAKASLSGRVFMVAAADPVDEAGGGLPGVVVRVDADGPVVASGRGAVRLRDLRDLDGTPRTAAELGLAVGVRLDHPLREERRRRLTQLAGAAAPSEPFWVRRFGEAQALTPTGLERAGGAERPGDTVEHVAVPVAPTLLARLDGEAAGGGASASERLAALAGALTGALLGRGRFLVAHQSAWTRAAVEGLEGHFSAWRPLPYDFSPAEDVADVVGRALRLLHEERQQAAVPLDLFTRTPALRGDARRTAARPAVGIAESVGAPAAVAGCVLTVAIAAEGRELHLLFDPTRLDAAAVGALARRLEAALAIVAEQPHGSIEQAIGGTADRPAAHIVRTFPLSPVQEGMLFHALTHPGAGFDHEQIVVRLDEPVDVVAMERAWQHVTGRFGVLRTAFRWADVPAPVQDEHASAPVPVAVHDWRDLTDGEAEARLRTLLADDRARGFALDALPLQRVHVARLAGGRHALVWSFPHIILDGRSFATVLQAAFEAYEALRAGQSPPDSAEPSYHDFIAWLEGRDVAQDRAFWRGQLQGLEGPTPLPRATTGGEPGWRTLRRRAAGDLIRRLEATATAHGLSPSIMVKGAWAMLLASHAGTRDVVFGATRACRRSSLPDVERIVGVLINTLPVRVRLPQGATVAEWLRALRLQEAAVRAHEHAPLTEVQQQAGLPGGGPLFESLVVIDYRTLQGDLGALGGAWPSRRAELHERTGFPLTLYAYLEDGPEFRLTVDTARYTPEAAEGLLDALEHVLGQLADRPEATLEQLDLLPPAARTQVLGAWNATATPVDEACLHALIERQAARTPGRTAVAFEDRTLTYAELDARATRLAHRLRALGVGPDVLVGLSVPRTERMIVGLLAILKAGGAYVPLDPAYPADRLAMMLEDSGAAVLLSETTVRDRLPADVPHVLLLDTLWPELADGDAAPVASGVAPHHLAYTIYTSGSTGRPKGVMVEHRNVANFFAGMDERLGTEPGTWLTVTSLSFDISVLEIAWTLARGFTVVVYREPDRAAAAGAVPAPAPVRLVPAHPVEFSLFYFSSDEGEHAADKYRLLLEGARFADRRGFSAVWSPERHFHAFGGLYPNPSVTSAALAVITERVKLRAGSVVLPLHHPARVAEEWALVDNLSKGRVGISFASGWQPNDFLLRPENYATARQVMFEQIETVRRLWRGEAVAFPGALGTPVEVRTLPRPVQPELPFWVTSAGNPETFAQAGRLGANVLTHLLGQSVDELGPKLQAYRRAWREAGHPGEGHVTLMLHTFVGPDRERVREVVRQPLIDYLRSSVSLIQQYAWSFPAFKKRAGEDKPSTGVDLASVSPDEMEALLAYSFERYYETSGLFGTVDDALAMVDRLRGIAVDEIACLIDFGIPSGTVLEHLEHLDAVRARATAQAAQAEAHDWSVAGLVRRYAVTHLQCTPSMAGMLLAQEDSRRALGRLDCLMVGGEALPAALAAELRTALGGGRLLNMYGPTETTIWSATHEVGDAAGVIPLGRPIANTEVVIADEQLRPLPPGMPGELLIGGRGVVRGYHARPELTAERFLANPFGTPLSERFYRTGDLARWRDDGTLEFLGRLDFQVKVRGYRIELGEIEAALREHPGVREAVVTAREDAPGEKRLVAYVAGAVGAPPDVAGLREHARTRLPEFMVPSAFVLLDAMPLTPNGKVDRKALPAPETALAAAPRATPAAPPASDVQRRIAEVWQQVLRVPTVGLDDNFFDLGGHSLLAVQAHRLLKDAFAKPMMITDLFRYPTVRSFARFLGDETDDAKVVAEAAGRGEARRAALASRRLQRRGGNEG